MTGRLAVIAVALAVSAVAGAQQPAVRLLAAGSLRGAMTGIVQAYGASGGPDSPAPPADRSIYGILIAERKADIFLTYCTNALQAIREVPAARMIVVPEALAVGADYGLTVIANAPPDANKFAAFVMSPPAQAILMRNGFAPGDTP